MRRLLLISVALNGACFSDPARVEASGSADDSAPSTATSASVSNGGDMEPSSASEGGSTSHPPDGGSATPPAGSSGSTTTGAADATTTGGPPLCPLVDCDDAAPFCAQEPELCEDALACSGCARVTHFAQDPTSWALPSGGEPLASFRTMFGSPSASTLGTHPTTWGTVDLNGDGVLDLVVFGLGVPHDPTQVRTPGFEVGSPHWLVYAGTPEGFDAVGQPWPIPTGGAVGAGFVGLSGSPGPLESATMGAEAWETIDLNGDGLLDLVVTAQASPHPTLPWGLEVLSHGTAPHWSVYLNTGSGFAATPLWWGVPWGGAFDSGFSTLQGSPGGHSYDAIGADGWTTADLDGDGIPELVRTATAVERPGFFWWPEVFGYPNDPHWLVHENTGDGFAPTASRWNLPPGGSALSGFFGFAGTPGRELAEGLGGHAWSVEDLDGDGALDLIVTAEAVLRPGFAWWPRVFDHDVAPAWRVHLGTRGGFDTDPLMWSLPAGGAHWSGFASASGVPGPAGSPEVQGADAWSLRDVTGDGAPDLVTTGRAVPRAGYAWWTQVLGHTQDLPQWSVYANTGAGFEVRGEPWRVPTRGDAFGGIAGLQGGPGIDAYETIGGHAWTTADVDGDARVDLIVMSRARARDGFFWWLETLGFADGSPHWDVYLGTP